MFDDRLLVDFVLVFFFLLLVVEVGNFVRSFLFIGEYFVLLDGFFLIC